MVNVSLLILINTYVYNTFQNLQLIEHIPSLEIMNYKITFSRHILCVNFIYKFMKYLDRLQKV